ncbi:MAG TPA: hypothetical protein VLQ89_04905, partial [Candidatus Binatia bacterium]|nr:hypothetical protein [Candidatus Binatia bacterium]
AMAAEPMALEFKSWKLVSSEDPVAEDLILQQLISTQAEIKAKRDKLIGEIKDKKDAVDALKAKLGETRGSRQKAELQKQIDAGEQEVLLETQNYKQIVADFTQMKNQVENEKKMVTMSTSIDQNQELMTGKAVTVKSTVNITTASGDKDYVFLLRKYELINPLTNKVSPNRFVILRIQPKEDFDQGK